MADLDVEWEHRRLCPDGACIGVIGNDNTCGVCGKVSSEAGGPFRASPVDLVDTAGDPVDAPVYDEQPVKLADDLGAADLEDRELCSDDACIGLIGANGFCNECGKPRAASLDASL